MSRNQHPAPLRPDDTGALVGWIQDVARQTRLAWRLFWDERVPVWTKFLPPLALAYILFPIDILPDVVLGLGQLDDAAILLIGMKLFIELSPPEVVREHLLALGAKIKEWRVVDDEEEEPPSVVEGRFELMDPRGTDEDVDDASEDEVP
jgi:uncharacterized membrane protein YkvA (DUF1232 family)